MINVTRTGPQVFITGYQGNPQTIVLNGGEIDLEASADGTTIHMRTPNTQLSFAYTELDTAPATQEAAITELAAKTFSPPSVEAGVIPIAQTSDFPAPSGGFITVVDNGDSHSFTESISLDTGEGLVFGPTGFAQFLFFGKNARAALVWLSDTESLINGAPPLLDFIRVAVSADNEPIGFDPEVPGTFAAPLFDMLLDNSIPTAVRFEKMSISSPSGTMLNIISAVLNLNHAYVFEQITFSGVSMGFVQGLGKFVIASPSLLQSNVSGFYHGLVVDNCDIFDISQILFEDFQGTGGTYLSFSDVSVITIVNAVFKVPVGYAALYLDPSKAFDRVTISTGAMTGAGEFFRTGSSGGIVSFADEGAGKTIVETDAPHGLTASDSVQLFDCSESYHLNVVGGFVVIPRDATHFDIDTPFVADDVADGYTQANWDSGSLDQRSTKLAVGGFGGVKTTSRGASTVLQGNVTPLPSLAIDGYIQGTPLFFGDTLTGFANNGTSSGFIIRPNGVLRYVGTEDITLVVNVTVSVDLVVNGKNEAKVGVAIKRSGDAVFTTIPTSSIQVTIEDDTNAMTGNAEVTFSTGDEVGEFLIVLSGGDRAVVIVDANIDIS